MAPVQSFAQLRCKAKKDENYKRLTLLAANTYGFIGDNLNDALRWLEDEIQESGEDDVITEINACRDDVV